MMRMSSMSDIKKSGKKSMDNRTTKTKASASKPDLFGISLARNKNNTNPILFNSVKKDSSQRQQRADRQNNYKSEKKSLNLTNNNKNILEQLHTKISFDYINSLYSDLGVQFGCQLKDKLQNKENVLTERNINLTVTLPSKEQQQCCQKIKALIHLKHQLNSAYNSMKNTQNILSYMDTKVKQDPSKNINMQIQSFNDIHQSISHFLKHFKSTQQQHLLLEHKYQEYLKQSQKQIQKDNSKDENENENENEEYLDSVIQGLKNQIANEKNLCIRYEKEEKFLLSKLYFTQKKNNDLRVSSSNLKIKNTNLRDTVRFSLIGSSNKQCQSPEPQRSFSVKLQRVKRYNLEEDPISLIPNSNTERQMIRSRSTSSLNSARRSFLPNLHKKTFLDKIY